MDCRGQAAPQQHRHRGRRAEARKDAGATLQEFRARLIYGRRQSPGAGATRAPAAAFPRRDDIAWRKAIMRSIVLWLLGVPVVVIILLNVFGMLG